MQNRPDLSVPTYDWLEDARDLDRCKAEILALLNESVLDDGMLGYDAALTRAEEASFLAHWQWLLAHGSAKVLLATQREKPLAMAFMRVNRNSNYRHVADLSKGFISSQARGGAILKELFARICQRAESMGVEQLTLDTREGSRALGVWRHFGFETFGVMPDYSRFDGRSHSGHFMSQRVAKLKEFIREK